MYQCHYLEKYLLCSLCWLVWNFSRTASLSVHDKLYCVFSVCNKIWDVMPVLTWKPAHPSSRHLWGKYSHMHSSTCKCHDPYTLTPILLPNYLGWGFKTSKIMYHMMFRNEIQLSFLYKILFVHVFGVYNNYTIHESNLNFSDANQKQN